MTGKVPFWIQTWMKCNVYMLTAPKICQFGSLDTTKLTANNVSLLCYV